MVGKRRQDGLHPLVAAVVQGARLLCSGRRRFSAKERGRASPDAP